MAKKVPVDFSEGLRFCVHTVNTKPFTTGGRWAMALGEHRVTFTSQGSES